MILSDLSVRRPVLATVLSMVIVVLGMVALRATGARLGDVLRGAKGAEAAAAGAPAD